MRARRPPTLLWDGASWGRAGWTGLDDCPASGGCEQHPGEGSWVLGLTVRLLWAGWRQGREEMRESPGLLILGEPPGLSPTPSGLPDPEDIAVGWGARCSSPRPPFLQGWELGHGGDTM